MRRGGEEEQYWLFVGHLNLACTQNFPIIACNLQQAKIVSRGEWDEIPLQDTHIVK